jgi:D-glycero-alpha-D-manno-heptose-7-phosphate kinase
VIIATTPLRIPLGGGLTDLRAYAERFGGVTVSATIGASAHATVLPSLDGRFEIHYAGAFETASRLDEIRHELVREALRASQLADHPLRVSLWLDVAGESGLGASGAMTVALLRAFAAVRGIPAEPADLATEAARIEVEVLGGASGYHDPHICARGDLRRLVYDGASVQDRAIGMTPEARAAFEASLMLFASGRQARTKPSLDLLTHRFEEAIPILHDIKALAFELEGALAAGDLPRVAWCIGEKQALKQRLPGHFVDDYVLDVTSRVAATGASAQVPGGKISGFVLVCAPEGQHAAVRRALPDLREVPLVLTREGTRALEV